MQTAFVVVDDHANLLPLWTSIGEDNVASWRTSGLGGERTGNVAIEVGPKTAAMAAPVLRIAVPTAVNSEVVSLIGHQP